ncbi:MAG: hypothetical protein ACOYJF_03380 [Prevotella sp.]|jgi:hypothetical protein
MTQIILISIVLVLFAIVVLNMTHKHTIEFSKKSLETKVAQIFADVQGDFINIDAFKMMLKNKFSCTSKEAHVIVGKAKDMNIITVENGEVKKV